ncbi:hypothetical protein BS50DRAFT_626027 [Corynespora cassiicola Philippines]|uniref:FAD-binding FR-type domain-containing protein n=1 Tax=Corynespora cassiicola Philippines TaxID=1448308 RepID=A0A2T2N4G4_CORCC|nr:hypothetical protein BS50DRAFT_626027 [Corynespora cassiicola Philippines]
MTDEIFHVDEVREQHHLQHRGQHNQRLTHVFWLAIATALLTRVAFRVSRWLGRRWQKYQPLKEQQSPNPGFPERISALYNAMFLFSPSSALFKSTRSSLSVGQGLVVTSYICIVSSLLVSVDAPRLSPHFIDDVAFRAAWVTLSQVPLVYLLSTKHGIINILAGLSYENINWIHKWVGRVLLLSATAHMSIMMSSISIMEIFKSSDEGMVVVRYGAGSYGILAWIALTSAVPLRRYCYWLFYINHWISTMTFLFILGHHIPKYAHLPIYLSLGLVLFDRCLSWYTFLWNNVTARPLRRFSKLHDRLAMGHSVKMKTPYITGSTLASAESTTVIRICDVPFTWRPGQHIRLYIPRFSVTESHPFTPASCSEVNTTPYSLTKLSDSENYAPSHIERRSGNDIVLMIREHGRFTRQLADYHARWLALPCPNSSQMSSSLTAYIDGPYGTPPVWEEYEHILLVSTSTGVSFTLSIMDYLEQLCYEGEPGLRTQRIQFIWAVRHIEPQFEATVTDLLLQHSTMLRSSGITVEVEFYASCPRTDPVERGTMVQDYDPFAHLRRPRRQYFTTRPPLRIRRPKSIEREREEEVKSVEPFVEEIESPSDLESIVSSTLIDETEVQDEISDCNSDIGNDDFKSSCVSGLPSWRPKQRVTTSSNDCQCALLQAQPWRLKDKGDQGFITQMYGCRPDINRLISLSISSKSRSGSMVAVCANAGLCAQAQNTVAKMNIDFALRGRAARVNIHTECFS